MLRKIGERKQMMAAAMPESGGGNPAGTKVVSDKVMLANMGVTVNKKRFAGGRLRRQKQ